MQSVINNKPAGGMVGEFYSTQLKTQHTFTSGSTITVGNAVTFDAVDPNNVNQGGTGLFAGILTEPKNYVMFNNLNPQLSIPAGISAHVGRGGYIWVYFTKLLPEVRRSISTIRLANSALALRARAKLKSMARRYSSAAKRALPALSTFRTSKTSYRLMAA